MEVVKSVVSFMCNSEFWRMAVLWSFSLIFSYLKLFYESLFSQESKFQPRCSLKDSIFSTALVARPVCIVTGATSGLGAAAAHALSNEGFYVVLVGRSSELLSKAISEIKSRNHDACLKAFEVNLSSFVSILEFKHSLQQWLQDSNMHSSVQLLINNAGILATSRRFTCEGYDEMLATNYIGAFCLTKVLLPLLESSPVPCRVVNVTSFTHRNVCILLFSYELHRKVGLMKKSQHLSIVAADPGAVQTNIMREIPSPVSTMAFAAMKLLGVLQSSKTGVSAIVDAALAPPDVSGVYFFGGKGRSLNSSALSYDAKLAKDLWDASCNLFEEEQVAAQRDGNCAVGNDE
ncbi:uncharacterized protein LOC131006673 isoform X5 [Salvia miltiorrhiza]|uniref:uncharacterized protein LOC131006673 isoform X5 n=1 Tax=Salvia miltiorrhiza TaxID=226208 RepID=UPI0025AD2AED|nr:uncharacterized protein LOC131006673 isoform X5 [Salvia miltiorrhiza]